MSKADFTRKTCFVIGAGASGLACAIRTKQLAGAAVDVIVADAAPKAGRSILVSGNGRCNFSNLRLAVDPDRGMYNDPAFVGKAAKALRASSAVSVLSWFRGLGLLWREETGLSAGMLYPYSNKAATVREVLLKACQRVDVTVLPGVAAPTRQADQCVRIDEVRPADGGFCLVGERGRLARTKTAKGREKVSVAWEPFSTKADMVVAAVGSAVTPQLVPGHGFVPLEPRLAALATQPGPIKGLDGVRARVRLNLPEASWHEEGEVLFREGGISGIVAFNASRHVVPGSALVLDFLPGLSAESAADTFAYMARSLGEVTYDELLAGTFEVPLRQALLRQAGLAPDALADVAGIRAFVQRVKAFALPVVGLANVEACQVHRGGCPTEEVDPATMASLRTPGLFVLGEALDVDGPCGGYNLDWAWTSGLLAGEAIAHTLSS